MRWRQLGSNERKEGKFVPKELLAAKELKIRVLEPSLAQSLVQRLCMCLRVARPAISRVGNGGWPGMSE